MTDTPSSDHSSRSGVRPIMRMLLAGVSLAVALGALEIASRYWLVPWHQEIGSRHMQPYFMTGGYFQTPLPGVPTHTLLLGPGGPETYGYRHEGGTYVFGFNEPVRSIAERGSFLFQDRVDLANAPPNPDQLRIFVIGGSAAYGVGASQRDRRWYLVLERLLSHSLQRTVRVVPAAMVGYGSTQERIAMELMVLPRSPDGIVILDGWNDAALPATFGVRPGDPYDQGILYSDFYLALGGFQKWLAKHSYLARYVVHGRIARAIEARRDELTATAERVAAYADSTSSVYLDNLSRMLKRCQQEGIPCVAFLQPSRDMTLRNQAPAGNSLIVASYDRIRAGLGTIAASAIDLSTALSADKFIDNVHFDDSGHTAVAEAMLPSVAGALARSRQP